MKHLCIDDGQVFFFSGSLPRPFLFCSPIPSRAGTNLPTFEPLMMMFWAKGDQQGLEIKNFSQSIS